MIISVYGEIISNLLVPTKFGLKSITLQIQWLLFLETKKLSFRQVYQVEKLIAIGLSVCLWVSKLFYFIDFLRVRSKDYFQTL